MRKSESTAKKTFSKPLTDHQWDEAINEFRILVGKFKEKSDRSETKIIDDFCNNNGISYNTFKKWLNKEQVNKKQESRIRSAFDKTFEGCHCHFIKEPEKILPQILRADHIIIEAIWLTTEDIDQLQETLHKQTEIISMLEDARKIGKEINNPGLSTLDSMKKNVEIVGVCKNLVSKLREYNFSIHIGQVASFKTPEDDNKFTPNDLSFIVCVNSIPPERETLNPDDFAFTPNFDKAI
jgi:hypothetical protein